MATISPGSGGSSSTSGAGRVALDSGVSPGVDSGGGGRREGTAVSVMPVLSFSSP